MASPPPGPPAWSVAVRLRHCWGLDIRAAAENVLPGWGRGGERLSLLLRFRRRLIFTVTSHCGARPAAAPTQSGTPPPRGGKILRFLRSRWARLPRITSIWRRKKHTPTRAAAAAAAPRRSRAQQSRMPTRPGFLAKAGTPPSAAALRLAVVAIAVTMVSILVFRIMMGIGCWNWRGGREGERISRWAKFLEFMEHPPPYHHKYKWLLGVPKRGLEWIFSE